MIPHKLTLRNFMCYRDDVPPLHFDGLSVVCLSGDNGVGKSALLDAITWALWGRARARSDDDLIALGQDEMEVDFEFVLDGALRRVVRRRSRGRRGQTIVDFQLCEAGGAWRRISGDGVRDTDAQIAAALRMNYETFINSAFLLQGRADEFTNRKPAERKQVLADILGLAEYEELEARAKVRRSRADAQLHNLQGLIDDHERQVARRPFLAEELERAALRAAAGDAEVAEAETATTQLRDEAERLRQLAETRAMLEAQIAREADDLSRLQAETAKRELRVAAAEEIVGRRAEIEAGVARLREIDAQLDELDRLREEAIRLNLEKRTHDDALAMLRRELELETGRLADEVAQVAEQAGAVEELEREQAALLAEAATYAELRQELQRLRADQEDLVERQQQLAALRLKRAEFQQPLNDIRQSLLFNQNSLLQSIPDLEKSVTRLPQLERDLEELQQRLLDLDSADEQLAMLRDELRAAEVASERLLERCETLKQAGTEIRDKLRLIETGDGACPVCAQELRGAAQARLIADYGERRASLLAEYKATKSEADGAAATVRQGKPEQSRLEALLREQPGLQKRHGELQALHEQARRDAAALREQQATLDVLDRQLADDDYGHAERDQLRQLDAQLHELGEPEQVKRQIDETRRAVKRIEARLETQRDHDQRVAAMEQRIQHARAAGDRLPVLEARVGELARRLEAEDYGHAERAASQAKWEAMLALGYSSDKHKELRQERLDHLPLAEQEMKLRQAEANLEDDWAALSHNRELIVRRETDLGQRREQLAALDLQLRGRQAAQLALADAERRLQVARSTQKLAQQELGRAEKELETCDRVAETLDGYRGQQAALAAQRGVYDELAQAFGKKGIQAMLIETAIPELEHEANTLLARMTDNQMHLSLETQRDSKKGDTMETLDIRIADSLGTRDYAMFSGGEAFRVNFALRIALSKLLAHRANATLRTLVIDEGFGTQDGRGRDRIVEAINAVSPDFERILVITHIQELKDLFPHQIEVTKGAAGSSWSLV